jgi:purine catabolism regulator
VKVNAREAEGVESFTVGGALREPCLRGAVVGGGAPGLGRPGEAVGVLDVSDLEGVQSNEFLVSNAYPLREMDLGQLVTDLVKREASALGIKLSEYWGQVPAELLRAAEALAFPLLVLPEGPFDEIVNPLLSAIAARQMESLRRSAELHAALTEAVLREEGRPEAITQSLTRALGAPIGIVNDRGEIVAATGPPDLWTSEELRLSARSVGETSVLHVDGGLYLAAPVPAVGRSWGTILAFGVDPREPFARSAVAQASVVTGVLLLGRRDVERIHLRFEQELLEDLIERRLADADEARTRAEGIAWPVHRPYALAILRPKGAGRADGTPPAASLDERETVLLARWLSVDREIRVLPRRHGLVTLIHLGEDEEIERVTESLYRRLLQVEDLSLPVSDMVFAVSDPHREVIELADAYYEAVVTSLLSRKEPAGSGPPGVVRFADLGPTGLLARAPDRGRLVTAARSLLGPLNEADQPHRELFDTLEALLSRNMNLSAAAQDMFFHYNTVRHRFARLQRLLGEQFDSAHGRLGLSLAVAAFRLSETERTFGLKRPSL